MLTVLGKHVGSDHAHLAEKESYDGKLEHYTHDQRQRHKGRDVRIERDVAYNPCRHAVSTEEAERNREQHEIGHQYAKDKKQIDDASYLYEVLALILIECGRYEVE